MRWVLPLNDCTIEKKKHNFEDGRETSDGEELTVLSESEKEDNSRPNSRAEGKIQSDVEDKKEMETNDDDGKQNGKTDSGSSKKKEDVDDAGSSSDEDEDGKPKKKDGESSKKEESEGNSGSVYKVTFLNPGKGSLGFCYCR